VKLNPTRRLAPYTPLMRGERDGLWRGIAWWLVLSTACCLFQFVWSVFPVTMGDEPPGPAAVTDLGEAALLMGVLLAMWSIVLSVAGLIRVRRSWAALVWVVAAGVSLALQVAYITGFATPWVSPAYSGPAVVDWVYLAESAALLIAGSVMIRIVGRARQRDRGVGYTWDTPGDGRRSVA
jgi:hypothetical protein